MELPRIIVPPCFVSDPSILTEWRYEKRHEAQMVLPGLWLGPMSVLRNADFFESNNVRLLVAVTRPERAESLFRKATFDSARFETHCLDPGPINSPLAGHQIISQMDWLIGLFEKAAQMGVGTLMFCETGNDRSATATCAMVMNSMGWDTVRSIQYVQSKRFSVALDESLKYNLQTYEDICLASMVVRNSDGVNGVEKHARKVSGQAEERRSKRSCE
ncbi:hypothetical protein LXG23DRAFT_52372 [Yarrowia lipolytica]|uniref:Tyrosine-protein phosphatase domain-containing protein n=1 Tax=Yarrowia lipolytica TaxID=4952 RepID=A0A1D8N379_YARLL|nr:hypothetical protein YALI1_A00375g [Yarrowia lipolytica]KAB8280559.1 hypothetical protein BKA91DRAFT_42321 [Yarrowia lipolytica]KAE8170116.1 hypothetical protein BKA90DRAFT_40358 [Yarrowia lipolytica]KAJ8051227.1 hypothetical protein LXG23DRAFT_52372 [Yarrowia lipolytica]RMI96881.1 hypothetical protein BD777DRAFT_159393 [Yarrowia lipolytica]